MEEDVTYGNYSQYKFFDGVELEWPYEWNSWRYCYGYSKLRKKKYPNIRS